MKQKWMIEVEMNRYFGKKPGFRARTKYGKVKDTIRQAVLDNQLREEFKDEEIKAALKYEIIAKEQIRMNGAVRNIYVYLGEECVYQPTWYKRWAQKVVTKAKELWDAR